MVVEGVVKEVVERWVVVEICGRGLWTGVILGFIVQWGTGSFRLS